MSVKSFKNYLKTQDEEWLRDELLTLYKTFESVREFYVPQIEPESTCRLIEKYKKKGLRGYVDSPVYAGMVENMDTQIGRILSYIDQQGLRDDTLIIFSSDNGGIRAVAPQDPLRASGGRIRRAARAGDAGRYSRRNRRRYSRRV